MTLQASENLEDRYWQLLVLAERVCKHASTKSPITKQMLDIIALREYLRTTRVKKDFRKYESKYNDANSISQNRNGSPDGI